MLQRIKEHRASIQVPDFLLFTAETLWAPLGKAETFLRTNCELTTYAIRDLLTPGEADNEQVWQFSAELPEPMPSAVEVIFGEPGQEDHFLFVLKGTVYQSFAFVHELSAVPYQPDKAFWQHIQSPLAAQFKDEPIFYRLLIK